MNSLRDTIDAARMRLPLPALLVHLDLERHARKNALCPLHEDRSPSFSVFEGTHGWRWKCHAGCGEGDEIDFLEAHFGLSRAEAMQKYCALAGVSLPGPLPGRVRHGIASSPASARSTPGSAHTSACQHRPAEPDRSSSHPPAGPHLPYDAHRGTEADYRELGALRQISYFAPASAALLGTLLFGTVCGFRCWILTDERRACAEARRMDGQLFPALGTLGARKAHTLRGSIKSWPVGLAVRRFVPSDFRALLAVEGGPDYLAALDFTLAAQSDCLPVAFLGAGSVEALHPDARPLFAGRRVRFYPHDDAHGAGRRAVEKWAAQLEALGCQVDAFDFSGLRRADGSAVKDLNDCTGLHPDDLGELEDLLP